MLFAIVSLQQLRLCGRRANMKPELRDTKTIITITTKLRLLYKFKDYHAL